MRPSAVLNDLRDMVVQRLARRIGVRLPWVIQQLQLLVPHQRGGHAHDLVRLGDVTNASASPQLKRSRAGGLAELHHISGLTVISRFA